MNISYLLSVLDLYLLKDKNNKLIIEVDNNQDLIKVHFSYSTDSLNKTFVKIPKEDFFKNIKDFINKVQGNFQVLNEDMETKTKYIVTFSEGRKLAFNNFSHDELTLIRDKFNNLNREFSFNKVEEVTYNQIFKKTENTKFAFSMGFSNYITLFLTSIWFLDIFMIALWIFKAFNK